MSKIKKIKDHKISKIVQKLREHKFLLIELDTQRKILFSEIDEIGIKLERLEAKEYNVSLDSENLEMELQEILKNEI